MPNTRKMKQNMYLYCLGFLFDRISFIILIYNKHNTVILGKCVGYKVGGAKIK